MADPLARITSILESAKEMTIEAAVSASTRLSETPLSKRPQEISALLNSRSDREVLNGLKCVMALVSRGDDVMPYFADVVKNVTSHSSRAKALVLVYIEKFAEMEPDTALLAINSIQKSLSDKKPESRAAGIRTLGGIRIPEIGSLLVLSIKRTVADRSPQVRAATALAIGSAYTIDGIDQMQLVEHLSVLLSDDFAEVVGSAIKVFSRLKRQLIRLSSKKAWAPIHANFRRYTTILPDLDPWAQTLMVDLLVEYCKKFIPRPTLATGAGGSSSAVQPESFADFPEEYHCEMDSDLALFVNALRPLSFSYYRPVVLSAVRAIVAVASPSHLEQFGLSKALTQIALDRSNGPVQHMALQLVKSIATSAPKVFVGLHKKYFLHAGDDASVAVCKLQVLSALFSENNARDVIRELQYNAYSPHQDIARQAVRAIGVCCQKSEAWTNKLLTWCTQKIAEPSASLITSDLLSVIRYSLQQKMAGGSDEKDNVRVVYKLSKVLHEPQVHVDEAAKASIIWLIGEFTESAKNAVGPDVVREFLKDYANQPGKVRYEILLLAAKVYSYESHREPMDPKVKARCEAMLRHVIHLARYDACVFTRDKVRMMEELFRDSTNAQLAALLMQVPKCRPELRKYDHLRSGALYRYMEPQPWAVHQARLPSPSIRNAKPRPHVQVTSIESPAGLGGRPNGPRVSDAVFRPPQARDGASQLQSLDEFFGNDSDIESESASESESESESASESESESESESVSESASESESNSQQGSESKQKLSKSPAAYSSEEEAQDSEDENMEGISRGR